MTGQNPDPSRPQIHAGQPSGRTCPTCALQVSDDMVICPNDGTPLAPGGSGRFVSNLAGQYEFLGKIGEGGMGVVYKARHIALNQVVAIKMLHVNGLDSVSRLRFQQEAKAVNSLDHPLIVRVRDFGVSESGQPHMVLDFIDGTTLEKQLKTHGALTFSQARNIFSQVCDAMAHAHERHVLHRDLKPGNIMLVERRDQEPFVKIVDFGIAKITDPGQESGMNLTRTGDVFGSPFYMSPEQIAGQKLDGRADIYSLGCVVFESLTGTPPFVGKNAIETLIQHSNHEPPTLKEASFGGSFPAELQRVMDKVLAKEPSDRYQTMLQFKTDLMKALGGNPAIEAAASKVQNTKNAQTKKVVLPIVLVGILGVAALGGLLAYNVFCKNSGSSLVAQSNSDKSNGASRGTPASQAHKFRDDEVSNTSDVRLIDSTADFRAMEAAPAKKILSQKNLDSVDASKMWTTDEDLIAFDQIEKTGEINLSGSRVEGKGLAHLLHLQKLRVIDLSHTNTLKDDAYAMLAKMKNLESLDLSSSEVTDAELVKLEQMPNLLQLTLKDNIISAKGLIALSHLPKLQKLDIEDCKRIQPGDWNLFKSFGALQTLDVSGTKFDDAGLKALCASRGTPPLDTLELDHTVVTDAGFVDIAKLDFLQNLSVAGTKITRIGLANILGNSNIQRVNVADCFKLKSEDIDLFCNGRSFKALDLSYLTLTAKNYSELSKAPISTLYLNHSNFDDSALSFFRRARNISNIYCYHSKVTIPGARQFNADEEAYAKAQPVGTHRVTLYNVEVEKFENSLRDSIQE